MPILLLSIWSSPSRLIFQFLPWNLYRKELCEFSLCMNIYINLDLMDYNLFRYIMDKNGSPLQISARLKFWYQHFVKGDTFEDSLKPVAVIQTVQDFWAYYQHFKRPTQLPVGSYIYLFKEEVKPVWEDQHNKNGGAFILRFQKLKCNRLWEDILLGYISANPQALTYLNGIRLKVKKDFAEIDFWVNNVDDAVILEQCRKWIIDVTTLENQTPLEVIHFHHEE